ncbi:MAG TPA: FHA domain-containing protein [Planctomycetota bacterium]|nr:FHA domain-containing protein [Planctomycetota bacterium]
MSHVIITTGPQAGTEFPLRDSQILGRQNKNAIPLDDVGASREHARIYLKDGRYTIVDLNSKNGVIVNGSRIDRCVLSNGDEIQIGETWLRVHLDEEIEIQEAAPERSEARLSGTPEVRVRSRTGGVSDQLIAVPRAAETRTSLAWLRTDLSQTSGLYRSLVLLGLLVLCAGLGYLVVMLTT